jgi:hypothetical protein
MKLATQAISNAILFSFAVGAGWSFRRFLKVSKSSIAFLPMLVHEACHGVGVSDMNADWAEGDRRSTRRCEERGLRGSPG